MYAIRSYYDQEGDAHEVFGPGEALVHGAAILLIFPKGDFQRGVCQETRRAAGRSPGGPS